MAKRKATRKKTTKRKPTRRKTTKKRVVSKGKYVVRATVTMKSKQLSKRDANALRTQTKKDVKGAVVKVVKV